MFKKIAKRINSFMCNDIKSAIVFLWIGAALLLNINETYKTNEDIRYMIGMAYTAYITLFAAVYYSIKVIIKQINWRKTC